MDGGSVQLLAHMRIGIRLPQAWGNGSTLIRHVAVAAENLGFNSLWCDMHVAIPASVASRYPLAALGRPTFSHQTPFADPFVVLAFAAALTRRIRLGTAVIPLMTTHPLTLAKQAASLDVVSDGRFELGIGAGWLTAEADVLARPTDHPSGRLAEAIQIVRAAWKSGTCEWQGRFYAIPPVGMFPTPPQGDALPLWIGGIGPAGQRLANRSDAGLLLSRVTPSQVRERLRQTPGLRIGVTQSFSPDDQASVDLTRAFQDAGADLLVAIFPVPDDELLASLDRFAAAVL